MSAPAWQDQWQRKSPQPLKFGSKLDLITADLFWNDVGKGDARKGQKRAYLFYNFQKNAQSKQFPNRWKFDLVTLIESPTNRRK
jgi:hypothetical protein